MVFSVFLFSWLVDYLLLMGVCQLDTQARHQVRILAASTLCAIYSVLALQPWFVPMIHPVFRCIVVFVAGLIAFECGVNGIRSCICFLLLHLAINGFLQPAAILRPWPILLASVLSLVLCVLGFPEKGESLVPVELFYGTNHMTLTALRDTGNMLHDPITGKPVLILGADAAQGLTGLSRKQLKQPIETIGAIPGLRLIPYRAIVGDGLLLALRIPKVRIGAHCGSALVAFAPEILSREGKFQALTGGKL